MPRLRPESPTAPDRNRRAGAFPSVLFDRSQDRDVSHDTDAPEFFVDLNLDQIVEATTAGWPEYDLRPFFRSPLRRIETIHYRHEVFRDLEDPKLLEHIKQFSKGMRDVRVHSALSAKLYDRFHKEMWFVHAVEIYCAAVEQFVTDLSGARLRSRGLLAFREYLSRYAASTRFSSLRDEAKSVTSELSEIKYSVLIRYGSFTVRNFHDEADYSAEVEATFEKFKQGAVENYLAQFNDAPEDLNHIEAKILEFVARLNPEPFGQLVNYCARHADFLDKAIAVFDREIQFYVSYLDQTAKLERTGLNFSLPEISDVSKAVYCRDGFDLALAVKLIGEGKPVVCNDFDLSGEERIIVVSGPNQGGKTTFARMFGQLHYLASLGCPVPARKARLFLFDQLFAHFEREEKVENLRGKLEDDLVRIRSILQRATSRSIIVLNEIFTSTTVQDETFLSQKVMQRIADLDLLGVWVTFVDELSTCGPHTVSMVSTVVPDQPALRTFRVERRRADGLAYAMAIAEKYGLTYERVKERINA
jgi:DNA mismatch repair protein MutS